jgi:hypothetical protein
MHMHYASPKHERHFRHLKHGGRYPPRTLAAVFLLTADRKLWRNWRLAVDSRAVDWEAGASGPDPGWAGYTLEKAARSIAHLDSPQVTLHDLADRGSYPTELILLILNALLLARGESTSNHNRERNRAHVRIEN